MTEIVELIKAVAGLLKPMWWPLAIFLSVWITRHEIRSIIKRISKLRIGHKDMTADVEITPELAKAKEAAEAVSLDDRQSQMLTRQIQAEVQAKASVNVRLRYSENQEEQATALRDSANALRNLEVFAKIADNVPRVAMKESFEILKRNVVDTAKFFGFQRIDETDSEVSQAVRFLSLSVFESQELMIGVYYLAAALQKVENDLDSDVSAKDARDFVRYCITFMERLSFNVRKLMDRRSSESS